MNQNIVTFFLEYSVVQGYLLSGYIWLKHRNIHFASVLFILATQILFHLYYQFEWFREMPIFIFGEAPLWYLIGPFFYLSILRLFNIPFSGKQLVHFIPFIIFLAYITPFYIKPTVEKIEIFTDIFSLDNNAVDYNHYLYTLHILFYLVLSFRTFQAYTRAAKDYDASSTLTLNDLAIKLLRYYLGFFLFALIFYIISDFDFSLTRSYYLIFYLLLSAMVHMVGYYAISLNESKRPDAIPTAKYTSSSLSEKELDEILALLKNHVGQFEVYRNPDLRLKHVAEALNIPTHHISQALSERESRNFFDIVNENRIAGFKANIFKDTYRNYTLFAIANEHGFKSPSSFYRIFKKHEGVTPKAYFKKEKQGN